MSVYGEFFFLLQIVCDIIIKYAVQKNCNLYFYGKGNIYILRSSQYHIRISLCANNARLQYASHIWQIQWVPKHKNALIQFLIQCLLSSILLLLFFSFQVSPCMGRRISRKNRIFLYWYFFFTYLYKCGESIWLCIESLPSELMASNSKSWLSYTHYKIRMCRTTLPFWYRDERPINTKCVNWFCVCTCFGKKFGSENTYSWNDQQNTSIQYMHESMPKTHAARKIHFRIFIQQNWENGGTRNIVYLNEQLSIIHEYRWEGKSVATRNQCSKKQWQKQRRQKK